MKFVKIALIALLALVVLVFVAGLFMPSEYHVERAVEIEASPEIVHALVGDLAQWDRWTPWKAMDPTIEVALGDTTTGVGAHQSWTGDSGDGELTFTASSAQEGIAYDMSFDQGKYVSTGRLDYEISGAGTTVTWVMDGEVGLNPISRLFTLMMDAMVGPSFEQGLAKLKAVAEEDATLAAAAATAEEAESAVAEVVATE